MTEDESEKIEKIARTLASLHGEAILGRDRWGETITVASQHGYGHWARSPERYADDHWAAYRAAAEWVLSQLKGASDGARPDAG